VINRCVSFLFYRSI